MQAALEKAKSDEEARIKAEELKRQQELEAQKKQEEIELAAAQLKKAQEDIAAVKAMKDQ